MKNSLFKAESLISVLTMMSFFAILFLSYGKWQQHQILQQNKQSQLKQAIFIAENQIALKMAGKPCQSYLTQNNLEFRVQCSANSITIIFPLGKFELKP